MNTAPVHGVPEGEAAALASGVSVLCLLSGADNAQIEEYLDKTTNQVRPLMHRELKKKQPAWKQFDDKWGLLDRNHSERVTRNSYG